MQVSLQIDAPRFQRDFLASLDWRKLLIRIGTHGVSLVQRRFKTQSIGGAPIPPRGSKDADYANIPAIIKYLARGQGAPDIPQRYFQRRPALIDTGRLLQSISYNVDGEREVVIGTNVEYAAKQFLGLPETMRAGGKGGDPNVRRGLAKYLKKHPEKRGALGWLFSRAQITARPKPRNVLEYTEDWARELGAIINDFVEREGGAL